MLRAGGGSLQRRLPGVSKVAWPKHTKTPVWMLIQAGEMIGCGGAILPLANSVLVEGECPNSYGK